jgi:hypothetical protein
MAPGITCHHCRLGNSLYASFGKVRICRFLFSAIVEADR